MYYSKLLADDYRGKSSAISRVDFLSLTSQADKAKESNNAGLKDYDFAYWDYFIKNATSGNQTVPLQLHFWKDSLIPLE